MRSDKLQKLGVPKAAIWRILRLLCSVWVICSECSAVQVAPQVSALKWSPGTLTYWEFGNLTSTTDFIAMYQQNGTTVYKVARHITNFHLLCQAPYPVKWAHKHYDRTSVFSIRTRTFRDTVNDIFDVSEYEFSATLEIQTAYSRTTGSYVCQSTASEQVRTKIYVYVLGYASPFLVYAGRTKVVKSEDNKTLVIPCIVSTPDAQVELYKRTGYNYSLETRSHYVAWDPQIGFTLTMAMTHMNDLFGDYKCIVVGEDEEDDYALFSAVPGIVVTTPVNYILQGNASYSFNPMVLEIKCCAAGAKAPLMRIILCEDAASCEIREPYVLERGSNGQRTHGSSCSTFQIDYRDTGVFRCKGDGIDVVRHFFSEPGHRNDKTMYFNWQDADPSALISVTSKKKYFQTSKNIYSNEYFTLSCDVSSYYYSEGIRWGLKWRNQTIHYLTGPYREMDLFANFVQLTLSTVLSQQIDLVANEEMESITCYAPIWNSTKWGSKTYELHILKISPPTIAGPQMEEFRWVVNQTNATVLCPVKNDDPNFSTDWTKNGQRIFEPDIFVREINGSSILIFTRVVHATQGDYMCLVTNPAGSANKTFRVIVDVDDISGKTSSSWHSLSVAFTVIVVLALLVGIGFLAWKLLLQKKIIDHFTRVVFRETPVAQPTEVNG